VAGRCLGVACAIALLADGAVRAQPATLDVTLARTASYVETFIDRFGHVVSEERYRQKSVPPLPATRPGRGSLLSLPPTERRTLRSDFLLIKPEASADWFPFRDTFEVDGQAVRDRENRLTKLFLRSPTDSSLEQARLIAQESSRYNIGEVIRTINNPVIALAFLERAYQKRFAFTYAEVDTSMGSSVWVVEYQEHERPTLIRGENNSNLPTRGRTWIDVETGQVHKTEFVVDAPLITARVTTTFKPDAKLGILVPAEMIEEYRPAAGGRISGRATYGRFRQFAVKTDERIEIGR
jgi:hypothetical protein